MSYGIKIKDGAGITRFHQDGSQMRVIAMIPLLKNQGSWVAKNPGAFNAWVVSASYPGLTANNYKFDIRRVMRTNGLVTNLFYGPSSYKYEDNIDWSVSGDGISVWVGDQNTTHSPWYNDRLLVIYGDGI